MSESRGEEKGVSGERRDAPASSAFQTFMQRLDVGILVVGLSASAIVFVTVPAEVEDAPAGVHVASLANSRNLRREVERAGGWAAVTAIEFNEWFDGLWHGRRLAGTLAVLSVGASLLCFAMARIPPIDD